MKIIASNGTILGGTQQLSPGSGKKLFPPAHLKENSQWFSLLQKKSPFSLTIFLENTSRKASTN
jgi:hypothetical protein